MANLDFYALRDDIRELVHFIYEETDARIFESYSECDKELREFRSFEELEAAFPLGCDLNGKTAAILLQIWSLSVTHDVNFKRITLKKVAGHRFRYCIEGIGLIQLYLGDKNNNFITHSHYEHWTEAGARRRAVGDVDKVDWGALSRISGRIQRHIRNKLAVAKLHSLPILPAALAAVQTGFGLRYLTLQFHADSPEIHLIRRSRSL